ncbi:MAG: response regulator receiver protein [Burkholderiales bacterium]|nr:response regulator receiver protein [Burkholderiales bacterium]
MEDAIYLALITGAIVYCVMKLVSLRRDKAFAETKEAEARFRGLTELSADWFWETDAQHRITWLSGGTPVAMLFGATPTYGKRLWELTGIEVEARALEAHLERLAREQPFFDLEIARTDERGARQVHIISGRSRIAADGRFLGYRGVGRDVTEQRSAERALMRAKDRLEGALDGGDLAEWHLEVATGELDVGDGWVRFLGYDRSSAVSRLGDLLAAVHAQDAPAARAALVRAAKGEQPEYSVEARLPTKRGGWKWLHARGRVTERDADGRALRMSGTFADIDERKRAEEALRDAEQRYRSLVELAPDGVIVMSGGLIEYANPAAARIIRAGSPKRLAGMRVEDFIHPASRERYAERTRYLEAGPGSTTFEERRVRALDGTDLTVEVASISFLERGRLVIQTVFRDVTESRRAREALAEREQRFRDVAESSGEYVWETDAEGRYTYLSERVEAVLGYSRAELLGRRAREFMPLGEERAVEDWFSRHGGEGRQFRELVHRSITKSGGVIWQAVSGKPLHAEGVLVGWRGTAADVTARKQAEARIEQLATRDALTGLANRALLAERAGQAILAAARSRSKLALLALDLDRFKLVNESLGHQAGDALLRAVSERLQNALGREATLARLGGDDFVLVEPAQGAEEAAGLASRVLGILARPFTIEGRALHVGGSIGIALYPDHGRDFAELLKCADAAVYHAKDCGRGTWRLYEPALGERAVARLRVENDLRGALARSELVLHWHPAVRGRSEIVGAEALVRWQHPQRGLLMPEQFVPLAEECGLIRAVGEWTLERALSQVGAWQASLPGRPWFAINVSAPELAQGEAFVQRIQHSLRENAVAGSRLEIEVTERVLMPHLPENVETLRRIGELGVRFAIDDFGTGYSSLAYLRRLPIDKLKIDRMFLRGIESDPADQAIVRTIASLARTLGMAVAAEGVDSPAQLEALLKLGCEEWQGHHFTEPLDASGFERLYRASLRADRRA